MSRVQVRASFRNHVINHLFKNKTMQMGDSTIEKIIVKSMSYYQFTIILTIVDLFNCCKTVYLGKRG